mgnify:CR=1 FL=1
MNKGWFESMLEQSPSIGFIILAILGGIVSHIRKYEASGVELTSKQHTWGVLRKIMSAMLTSFIVAQLWIAMAWPVAFGFVVAGIVAVFSGEALDFMWRKLQSAADGRLGK